MERLRWCCVLGWFCSLRRRLTGTIGALCNKESGSVAEYRLFGVVPAV